MKTKKIDREFLLSDSSVNVYGFRLMTDGCRLNEFKKNPIGFLMHDREAGVVVKWENLHVKGDQIMGTPVINLSNAKGPQCVDEIDNGFLNAASVGQIVALKISEDPKDILPGQTGPTVKDWYFRECSICDIPGNMNSLALCDKDGNEIKLTDFKIQNKHMEKIILTADQLAKMNLKSDSDVNAFNTAFDDLLAKAAKADALTTQLGTATTAKADAEKKYNDLVAATATESIATMLTQALTDKKITKELKAVYEKQYAGKPEDLKAVLAATQPYTSVVDGLKKEDDETSKVELADLLKKTGNELFMEGKLERLKELSAPHFKIKYKEAFGEEPKEEKKEEA